MEEKYRGLRARERRFSLTAREQDLNSAADQRKGLNSATNQRKDFITVPLAKGIQNCRLRHKGLHSFP